MAKWIAKFSPAPAKRYEIEAEDSFDDALPEAYRRWEIENLPPNLNTLCRAEDELTGIKLVMDRIDAVISRLVYKAYGIKRKIRAVVYRKEEV